MSLRSCGLRILLFGTANRIQIVEQQDSILTPPPVPRLALPTGMHPNARPAPIHATPTQIAAWDGDLRNRLSRLLPIAGSRTSVGQTHAIAGKTVSGQRRPVQGLAL
jgi:hypothetical protein